MKPRLDKPNRHSQTTRTPRAARNSKPASAARTSTDSAKTAPIRTIFTKVLNARLDHIGCPPLHFGRQKWLADRFGVSDSAARKWLNGDNFPEPETLVAIADDLGLSLDELFGRAPGIPVLSATTPQELSASGGAFGTIAIDPGTLQHTMQMQLEGLGTLVVPTDSMAPNINRGDIAFVDTNATLIEDNKVYLLGARDRLWIRRCFVAIDGTVELLSDNDSFPPVTISLSDISTRSDSKAAKAAKPVNLIGEIPWVIKRVGGAVDDAAGSKGRTKTTARRNKP